MQDEKAWGITSNVVINGPWRAKIGESTTHGDSWTSAKPIPARRMLREVDGTNGGFEPLRGLLLQQLPTGFPNTADEGLRDEVLLSAFAPKHCLLDSRYIDFPEDWTVFRWLRGNHNLGGEQVAEWYMNVAKELRPTALRYLVFGALRDEVLRHLVSHAARPSWLQEFATVRRMLESICAEPWRRQKILDALFAAPPPPPANFFRALAEWWDDADERRKVIQRYERRAWPEWLREGGLANHLRDRSLDHWRALLILGACRSIGQTTASQHRWFLEKTREQDWWDVFKRPDDSQAWMAALRTWQDHAFDALPYPQWTGLFPAIYQLCRYLDVYINVLTSAGRRSPSDFDVTRLLRPRVDFATRGAGVHFDAPPAPLKMGRHWVLRELVRLGVIDGDHLYKYSYVPNEMVQDFLVPYGYEKRDSEPHLKARGIFDFMESKLGPEGATLHRCFDIPLRHVARDPKLRSGLGL